MDDDDRAAGQLVVTGDPAPDVLAVVDEELQVQPRGLAARVAVARRGLLDAPQAASEGDVGRLDRVEQERGVRTTVFREQERRIALELGEAERRFEPAGERVQRGGGPERSR